MGPPRGWLALGATAFAAGAATLVSVVAFDAPVLVLPMLAFGLVGTVATNHALASTRGGRFREGIVSVEGAEVLLDGALVARTADIEQGIVLPTDGADVVRLEMRGARLPVCVQVTGAFQGDELLRAVGLDPAHAAAELRLASRLGGMSPVKAVACLAVPAAVMLPMIYASGVLLGRGAGPFAFALAMLALTYLFAVLFAPTTVRIGTDGVVVRWLGRERFIPYSAMRDVGVYGQQGWQTHEWYQHGMEITLAGGETLRVSTGRLVGPDVSDALVRRINDARAASAADPAMHPVAAVARGARAPHAWVTALRQLGSGASADARSAAVPLDALLGLIEDGSAAAIDRVSAAVAALPYADDETRRRIRLAADSSASPKLRVALDRVEREQADEAAIAETLVELEDDAATAAVRGRCASD
jgi:hypothetical protein